MFAGATTNLPPTLILAIGSLLRLPSSCSPSDLAQIDSDACPLLAKATVPVDDLAELVDGPVQVSPPACDFDVRFIAEPPVTVNSNS
jgi:hypothetical protein